MIPAPACEPRPPRPQGDPWRAHPARVVGITAEVPGVRTYELELEEPAARAAYRFAPGQFNMLHLPGIGEAAISISSDAAAPARLAHTVRAVGNVTLALERLLPGDQLLLRGPFGNPWPVAALADDAGAKRDVIVVGGGLGLASQRAAILELARRRGAFRAVVVLHGAKHPDGLLYAREYDAWRTAGIDVRLIVDQGAGGGWAGPVGVVTRLLAEVFAAGVVDPARTSLLCCGPDPMMTAVAEAAAFHGVDPREVLLSLERNMACAVRHCGLCQFGPFFVCQDGPVFRYAAIREFLAVPHL